MRHKEILHALTLAPVLWLAAAASASGYSYNTCNGGNIVWSGTGVTLNPANVSFDPNVSRPALDAVAANWNSHAPGSRFRFNLFYVNQTTWLSGDGINTVGWSSTYAWPANTLAMTFTRWGSCFPVLGNSNLNEADVIFNPNAPLVWSYDIHPALPPSPGPPYSLTLTGLHEFGHAMGMNHESNGLATLNPIYPFGGTLGQGNFFQPHANDLMGDRAGYGTCCSDRDVAVSPYVSTGNGNSVLIAAPATAYKGKTSTLQFTILNRGTVQESSVPVNFYLSTDRIIGTQDIYLGSATFSLSPGAESTFSATLGIPTTVPAGTYYFGYFIDPVNAIPEVDEFNNTIALPTATNVPAASPPNACIRATPISGNQPLAVSFTSCSTDPLGASLTSYAWNFGDGSTATGASVRHTYVSTGFFQARLTVTNSSGLQNTAFMEIDVSCPTCPK
jgi:hypothetical protein